MDPRAPEHRSLEAVFARVLPPRPVPLRKRLFWHLLLGLMGWAPTRTLLLRLRGGDRGKSST
jgi:hypothetical protein